MTKLEDKGINRVFVAGDIIDGINIYRNNSYGCSDDERKTWDVFYVIISKKNHHTVLVESWELIDPKNKTFEINFR